MVIAALIPGFALGTLLVPHWRWWQRLAMAPGLSAGVIGVLGLAMHDVHVPFEPLTVLPVILALGAVLFAGEHMPRIGWIALITSTLGAALIAFSGNHLHAANAGDPSLIGDLRSRT